MTKSKETGQPAPQADGLRGVIDRFEEDLLVIVFDDGQQLVLPRKDLARAKVGDAVVARVGAEGKWHGVWRPDGQFALDDGQALHLPGTPGRGEAKLSVEVDPVDTAARRKRVENLLDDLFKQ